MFKLIVSFFLVLFFFTQGWAEEQSASDEKRSIVIFPFITAFVPGLGQAIDGEYKKSGSLLGLSISGFLIASEARQRKKNFLESDSVRFHSYRDSERAESFGNAMYKHAAGIALYDSFLGRVSDYHSDGKYLFLPEKQNIESIHKAPFEWRYLGRPTTFIPLMIGFGLGISDFNRSSKPDHFDLRVSDVTASSYQSYVAGVTEEAMFRGWLQPILYENTENFWLTNTIQALAFGYSHNNPRPFYQIAFGFYAGWLAPRNNWDLGETIFIHTWWDVIVITAEFARSRSTTHDFNIQLPVMKATF